MVKRKRFKKNQPFKWKHYSGEGTVAKNYSEFQKGYFLVLATLELSS
ncbi:hypothetical protein PsalN5692_04073 (plasmid) [Piscirickettsia salmonis]|nr:hypothetical protein [Piscirickettsia salmonis]QGP52564.1 hypothetical protein PsalN5692_04073 [Piscirickettsia salmonis]